MMSSTCHGQFDLLFCCFWFKLLVPVTPNLNVVQPTVGMITDVYCTCTNQHCLQESLSQFSFFMHIAISKVSRELIPKSEDLLLHNLLRAVCLNRQILHFLSSKRNALCRWMESIKIYLDLSYIYNHIFLRYFYTLL